MASGKNLSKHASSSPSAQVKESVAAALRPDHELAHIRGILRSRLTVTNVDQQAYPQGYVTNDEVITSNRYILILRGGLDYEIEGLKTRLEAGSLIFVPAWVRRRWEVFHPEGCENLWCEFSSFSLGVGHHALFRAVGIDFDTEQDSLRRLFALWRSSGRPPSYFPDAGHSFIAEHVEDGVDLQMEGELKATLSRFWTHAVRDVDDALSNEHHPEIQKAVGFIEENFHHADALERLYSKVKLSGNHFRILFKQWMKTNPRDYLNGVRMRQARHLIHHSDQAVKTVAYSVGFNDPLHFSKQYHAHWGHFPTKDRQAGRQSSSVVHD